jgi:N-acyl-L-homoserine lactone synthetase
MLDGGIAASAADVSACQEVRFHVFCRERTILREEDFPDEMERDDFDEIATHLAIRRACGEIVGTARLVPFSHRGFPLERYSDAAIPVAIAKRTVEVSRLAVPQAQGGKRARLGREVGLQLFRTIYSAAKRSDWTHLVAAMEQPLVRLLTSHDIPARAIGPAVDFGGWVRPYMISIAEFDTIDSEAARFFRAGARPALRWSHGLSN